MKRKLISTLLCVTMAAGMMTACTGKGEGQDNAANEKTTAAESTNGTETNNPEEVTGEKQVLKVAALEGGYGGEMWEEIAKAFEEIHPEVKVELTVDKKIEDVISPAMKAGDYPDVVHCATGREAGLTETLTKEKGLLALTDVMDMRIPGEEQIVKDKILPGFLDTLGTNPYNDGVTYYAPMFYSPCGLFYNAGLLKEKGWSVPTTWDEMWELGDKAKAEGISLFTYPTPGYFDAFLFAALESSGGVELFNKAMTYEDGIWETPEASAVFELIGKLADYTEPTTVANANNDNFTKNQQLILDNKAIFCPNGTWLPGEMADAPKSDGFEWGFTAVPAVAADAKPSSYTFFEQMWIPVEAKNQEMAKEFVAFMYSDKAAGIFANANAVQPIEGVSNTLNAENQLYYTIYDGDAAVAVMGGFAVTTPVEGVSMTDSLFNKVNSVMSGDVTVEEWQSGVEAASDLLREAME